MYFIYFGCAGIMITHIMYAKTSGKKPVKTVSTTVANRTIVGSIAKYPAIPPHTPSSNLSVRDLYSRFTATVLVFT